jgi:NADPH:quinone reductase-like Zn-dependent oxidoreductase
MKTELRKFVSDKNLELHTVETEFEDEAESAASASKPKEEAKNEVDGFLELAASTSTKEAAEKSVDGLLELTASASTEEAADKAGSGLLELAASASTEEAVEKSACSSTGLVKEGLENYDAASKDDKDMEAVSIQKDDESEHPSTVSSVAKLQQVKTDAEESSAKTRESVGTDAAVTVSRERKATIPATAALHHADVSYIPWLGVQLEYKPMPAMSEIWEDDVLIRVEATTISTRDCLERIRRDKDVNLHSDSWVPGHEIVGRVVRVGGKSRFLKNRRVAALLPAGGGCSRHVRCRVDNLIAVPEHARSQDIVYLMSTYLTAYQCLEQSVEADQTSCCVPFKMAEYLQDLDEEGESLTAERMRNPLFGKSVLINGAGSPVGQALIDIARHAGATVYALSHSQHEYNVQQMGVKEGGWYPLFQTEGWKAKWKGKMDVIVDTIGDYGNYASFYDVLAFGGRFVRVNTTSAGKKFISAPIQGDKYFSPLKHYKESHINRVAVDYDIFDSFEEDKKLFTEDLTYLFQLLQSGKIKRREFSHIGLEMVEQEWNKAFEGKTDVLVVSCNESGSGSSRKLKFTR